jgi:hypothetical protein
MPIPFVIAKVRHLHQTLAETPPPAHPAVGEVAKAVDTVMVDPEHEPHYEGLREKLAAATRAIEAQHPKLAAAMEAVVQSLSTAGL